MGAERLKAQAQSSSEWTGVRCDPGSSLGGSGSSAYRCTTADRAREAGVGSQSIRRDRRPPPAEMAAQRQSAEAILACAEHAVRGQFKDLRIATAQADGPADEALGPKLSWGFSANAVMTKASWTGLASRR